MTEENKEKEKKRAYHRQRYAKNIEKERQRNRDKYHKNKKLLSDLSDEEKRLKRERNRISYENWLIRQGKNHPQRDYVIGRENLKQKTPKEIKIVKIKEPKKENSMKKFRLPSRITHKYVSEVLRKFPKSRLCNILISTWTLAELKEFELLEEEFNKND